MPQSQEDRKAPHVIGWHDSHGASAAVLSSDGAILYAAAEERFTKRKLQKGYPEATLADIRNRFGSMPMIHGYQDMPLAAKALRNAGLKWTTWWNGRNCEKSMVSLIRVFAEQRAGKRAGEVRKGDHAIQGDGPPSPSGIAPDFVCEHHRAHAASAYYLSGFDHAYIVTVDGVGDCLSGGIFVGRGANLTQCRKFYYNDLTVGADYETFTAMLGFNPDRHCGKITGLAAYGSHSESCIEALAEFLRDSWRRGRRNYFDRMHGPSHAQTLVELRAIRASRFGAFSKEDLAFAIQHMAEQRVLDLLREHVPDIAGHDIALAGGVFANVRINQKVKELGFRNIFIQPAMDDSGLALGVGLDYLGRNAGFRPRRLLDMFLGPGYDEGRIQEALDRAGVAYERVQNLASAVAKLLADGNVVGRFDGRMEFGPRALGNRSILYDTRDPSVNAWLNKRLNRTDFMPFAPATLEEHAEECYQGLDGCRHTAEFMTITFPCSEKMRQTSPAVVHVDGTARAQLVSSRSNPGFHEILHAYHKITGIPSLVNTSFNMHESPIVNTPEDAVQTFLEGKLDYLAIGPFLAKAERESLRTRPVGASLHCKESS